MTPTRAAQWATTRSHGKWRFVWRTGVLGWGLIMCGIFVGMQASRHPDRIFFILALNVPLWLCAGFVFGILTWLLSEWSFRRYLAKSPLGAKTYVS
jgi:hypothetical protein